jgi:hypothetical protein
MVVFRKLSHAFSIMLGLHEKQKFAIALRVEVQHTIAASGRTCPKLIEAGE